MPPIQHTFGTTGNAPSHPGAGVTQIPQNRPLQTNNPYNFSQSTSVPAPLSSPPPPPPPHPSSETNKAEEQLQQQYTSSPPTTVSPSHNYNYAHESTYPQLAPHTYANPYNNYNDAAQLPQEPIPAYTRDGQNDSPDLLAARREYIDIETQIQNETTELNHRLTNPSENSTIITSLQSSIRKLYIRQGALMQRIQDLQDPNSYAFRQSQAMTTTTANYPNNQTPLIYDGNEHETEADRNRALTLANYTVKPRERLTGCICLFILFFILGLIVIVLVVKKKHR
ncbi:hypothetical protein TWF192_008958 [Orbilia oligospora]|uniref:Uncharacterized protein n=1 Tax=Orbilia oligospora TaxID=2813651 RepID=A0A6G1MJP2_ORBOL|nr:hypothetical protein TWF191_010626 [Orbilia oligospora]KAF3212272.1 hypothetical protein TWF679_006043 [Orbilia oligospora]KAF3261026.1 hypothetical protein TWF192_008958 [Orbilia oligospora]